MSTNAGENRSEHTDAARILRWLRGFTIWRVSTFGDEFALNATRWLYLSNHAYKGDRRWYVRIGKRPGWVRSFGRVVE